MSTLKLNAKILRELGMILFGNREEPIGARMTYKGATILEIVSKADRSDNVAKSYMVIKGFGKKYDFNREKGKNAKSV